ncbi:mechanosensitive ion channel family protein [Pseudooceanicola sp. MF1-13]|uniref:mechanosensitive ion channel family protein n=1 Tax=Pseudooceanicola sp. MF1-13 TaxID=3379095 RepID=UPI00389153F4
MENLEPLEIVNGQITGLVKGLIALIPNLIAAVILLILTALVAWGISALVTRILRKSNARPSLRDAVGKLVKIVVWALGLLVAATILFPNLTPTKMIAGLGIGSIAIGLAFKDIFENFLAGFLILLRKPMRIGDDIECESVSGRVEHISIRDTFIRKRSGELVLLPNSYLFKNPVKVLTDEPLRRIEITVGVAYDEDVDQARDVITKAMEGIPSDKSDKPVQVFAKEFNSSSIDFMVRWWTESAPIDEHKSRDKAIASIKRALDDAGIEIPFPYRTLTFKEPLPLSGSSSAQDA